MDGGKTAEQIKIQFMGGKRGKNTGKIGRGRKKKERKVGRRNSGRGGEGG